MNTQLNLHGTLQPDGITLLLETKLALPPGPVTVAVQPVVAKSTGLTAVEVLERIHRKQAERGQPPKTREEMEAEIAEIRDDDEYEERLRQIYANTTMGNSVTE